LTGIRVEIEQILFDQEDRVAVLLLKEQSGERRVPIWIGQPEALSIAAALEGVVLPRPMTHDLLSRVIERLGGKISDVTVTDVVDGTFLALVRIESAAGISEIDSRPSDAVALALRASSPVFVAERVFAETSGGGERNTVPDDVDEDYLAHLPEHVFGKYKM